MPTFNLFKKQSAEDKKVEEVLKGIRQQRDRTLAIADYAARLKECRMFFERTMTISRLNVLDRREAHMGDSADKARVKSAVIGLLATEEAEYDLKSLGAQQSLDTAIRNLGQILKQMNRMNPGAAVTDRDVREAMAGKETEDTNAAITFSQRAELVDDSFVERIINGESVEACLAQTRGPEADRFAGQGKLDFRDAAGDGGLSEEDEKIIREMAMKR